jgi:hypothetical protein
MWDGTRGLAAGLAALAALLHALSCRSVGLAAHAADGLGKSLAQQFAALCATGSLPDGQSSSMIDKVQ